MKPTNWKYVAELIGLTAIVASLIFVGLQLLLDRRVAIADQYSHRAELRLMTVQAWLQSDSYMTYRLNLWNKGNRPVWWSENFEAEIKNSGYSGIDTIVEMLAWEMDLLTFDNVYFQYQQGLIAEEFWHNIKELWKQRLRNPRSRAVLLNTAKLLPVQELLLELVAEIDNE